MAFATVTDLLNCYDSRRVCELLLDNSDAPPTKSDLTLTGSDANTRLLVALAQGAEEIVAAAVVGNRYSRADLEGLVSDLTATPSGHLLIRLNVDLAFGFLIRRRAWPAKDSDENAPSFERAEQYLTALRNGERVFIDISGQSEAGLPEAVSQLPNGTTGSTSSTICPRPLLSQNTRIFGTAGLNCPPYGSPFGGCGGW